MSHTILIIDDDHDILRVLKANLELHNFTVITGDSWAIGEKELSAQRIDLLLLDLMLPDGDGVEICRRIRKVYPWLPIIMLTARDKVSDRIIGLESGADDYVVKPFETLELIARIKACLRRAMPHIEDSLTIGDLNIDFKRRIVKVKNKEVVLTPKEYDLLCLLVTRRGTVLTRKEIIRHLWGKDKLYSWSRVIDVHIQHLREKIRDDPEEPRYIITVAGVGYRFKSE
ncbi:MAG: response regulator transcription factor [Thermodesulfovibrionia bacterium]